MQKDDRPPAAEFFETDGGAVDVERPGALGLTHQ